MFFLQFFASSLRLQTLDDTTGSSESLVRLLNRLTRVLTYLWCFTDKSPKSKGVDACSRARKLSRTRQACIGASFFGQITRESRKSIIKLGFFLTKDLNYGFESLRLLSLNISALRQICSLLTNTNVWRVPRIVHSEILTTNSWEEVRCRFEKLGRVELRNKSTDLLSWWWKKCPHNEQR